MQSSICQGQIEDAMLLQTPPQLPPRILVHTRGILTIISKANSEKHKNGQMPQGCALLHSQPQSITGPCPPFNILHQPFNILHPPFSILHQLFTQYGIQQRDDRHRGGGRTGVCGVSSWSSRFESDRFVVEATYAQKIVFDDALLVLGLHHSWL